MEIALYEQMRPFITWMQLLLCEKLFARRKDVLPPEMMKMVLEHLKSVLRIKIMAFGGRYHLIGTHANYDMLDWNKKEWTPLDGVHPRIDTGDGIHYHKAIRLPNGIVLITGGSRSLVSEKKCSLLTKSLMPAGGFPDMNIGRRHHSSVVLMSGVVMVAGGSVDHIHQTDTIEYTHASVNRWVLSSVKLPWTIIDHAAVVLVGGNVLFIGGHRGDERGAVASCTLFISEYGTFVDVAPMSVARGCHAACLLPDGQVLVAGGFITGGQGTVTCEIFNPGTGSWTVAAAMKHGRYLCSLLPLLDGPLIVGSVNSEDIPCEQYLLSTRQWVVVDETVNDHTESAFALIY